MPLELLFELDDVRITPHVAQFGGTSYQIASIGSVRVVRLRKRNPLAVIAFFLGLGLVAAAAAASRSQELAERYFPMAASGVGIVAAAFLLQLLWPRRAFMLILKTSSGNVEALTSRKKKFVFDVKQALEQAFIARGHGRT
jgi:Family of unknown function (DUF6232)